MLAYQHISQHFGNSQNNESRLKRSMSPVEMSYRKEPIDCVRNVRRRSLSRSTSPIRSNSPTMSSTKSMFEHHLIKRSLSEEDLRMNHERKRLSMEPTTSVYSHRPQIFKNYCRELKAKCEDKITDVNTHEQCETSEGADDDTPLDLSMGSKKRRGRTESGTDSDDSTGLGDEGRNKEGRAYKKSLMKRYCEFNQKKSLTLYHDENQSSTQVGKKVSF